MDNFLIGLHAIANLQTLLMLLAGSAAGIIIGVLPGIGPGVAISVMLPLTYGMAPLAGITLLLGIYVGAFYGGAVTSILIRTPGEASSVMTMFDGYPMAQSGQPARALSLAFGSAFIGGVTSVVALAFVAQPIAQFTLKFGAAEFTTTIAMAFAMMAYAYSDRIPLAIMGTGLGVFIATVGLDANSSQQRYTFGVTQLLSGFPLIPIVIGLFGMAQAIVLFSSTSTTKVQPVEGAKLDLKAFLEPLKYPGVLSKAVGIGTLIGILPAVGSTLSTTLAYFEAKRSSPDPSRFGKGEPRGIVAAEGANNSNSGGAMTTLLTLGVPGDAITAIIMVVFFVHGVPPGPGLFTERPDLVYGIFAALIAINVCIFGLLLVFTKHLASLMYISPRLLGIVIMTLCTIGAFSVSNSFYDVGLALASGLIGWMFAISGVPVVPIVLGMVMGDIFEASLRQALTISDGSFLIFLERPISAAMLLLGCLVMGWGPLKRRVSRRRQMAAPAARKA